MSYQILTGIYEAVDDELKRARDKFPNNDDLFIALVEEVGELGQALIQQKHEPEKGVTSDDIRKEAIQVAVMGIRVATEGDSGFPDYE